MNHRKTHQYLSGGVKAEVTHLWNDNDKHYIRLRLQCEQSGNLVTADFAMGTADELRERYIKWQNVAIDHAAQFGDVHIAKTDA